MRSDFLSEAALQTVAQLGSTVQRYDSKAHLVI